MPPRPVRAIRSASSPEVIQGAVEGVASPRDGTVEWMGEHFRIAEKVGLMPLMRFAHAAAEDLDTSDMEALAAIYDMLSDCIYAGEDCDCSTPDGSPHAPRCAWDAGDWRRFERHATKQKADAEDMLPLVQRVIELVSARPTSPQSGSSRSAQETSAS